MVPGVIGRRHLLRQAAVAGLVAAGGGLTACARVAQPPSQPPHRASAPPAPPPPPVATPATAAAWRTLAGQLAGSLLQPGQSGYDQARELFNPEFDSIRPAGVAYCQSATDVQRCIDFVRQHGLPVALRSGGHKSRGAGTVAFMRQRKRRTLACGMYGLAVYFSS